MKALVAQGGGPTAVINQSLAGVVLEARRFSNIESVYGACHGVAGISPENIVDLGQETTQQIELVADMPGSALGSTRDKPDIRYCQEILRVLQAHGIGYFFYIGGNDSQDTSHKIHLEAVKRGWDMRVIGVPKTIDNDLPHTDSCPGYGSVIKYNAATVMEIGLDVASMATDDGSCCIVEVMGRAAGWIAAGTVVYSA